MNVNFLRHPFRYAFYNMTLVLIMINVAVYLFFNLFPQWKILLCLNVVYFFDYHLYWQIGTYMFVHENLMHLIFNMIGLFFFGFTVEKALGSKEFILMYLLCGVLSGISSVFLYRLLGFDGVVLLGASGAIYSLLFAYAVLFPRSRIYIWGILPVPAPLLVICYVIIELGGQLFTINSGVAHLTHLAGFVFAWLYLKIRMGINPVQVWKDSLR
jgi:membrane associated rhomboid family serine protease